MTETTKPQNADDYADKIWDFFCSLKLTIIILLLLSILSIIGTVLQQNAPAAEYIKEYGQSNYELFVKLQFVDMYHSWWFIGLLGLFSVNLICCSIKNFPRVWKFVTEPALIASPGILKNSANRLEATSKDDRQQLANRLSALLKKEFGSAQQSEKDGKLYLFAQKGIYSRFGAYMTHLSILVIMAGAIIGNVWGYKAYVNIVEGTSTSQVWSRNGQVPIDLGFTVRCDDFDVSYYANSRRPRDYNSDLVVIDNGQEVLHKRIEVNDPLTYKGITFYQSSYGSAGNPFFQVKVTENATGNVMNMKASMGQPVNLPGGYAFAITDFTAEGRFGPAARVNVSTPDGRRGTPFMVLKDFPEFDIKRGGKFSFSLVDYKEPQFTGLQVAKDPGVEVVWLGCLLMVFGSLTAFFFSHRRIWVCLEEDGGKTKIQIAANAHRNQPGFSLAFDELKQKLDAAIENKSSKKEG
ncbi:MAG TPA: cytochrome c biogenesis protein ResB [Malonomonas sp.]